MIAAVSFSEFRDNLVTGGARRPSAEQFGEFQILSLRAFLTAADRQFRVTRRDMRLVRREFFGREKLNDIDERPARADRRELTGITDQDDPINSA